MLVVGTDLSLRPTPEQISDVVYEWGKQWAQDRFPQEINGPGKSAYDRFLERVQQSEPDWNEIKADSLLCHLNKGTRLGYNAIPSVIATLLAQRSSTINGRTVTWRLAQDDSYGLAVVSNPFTSQYQDPRNREEKKGTFAYKLEFRLQTQVGSPHRWLHLYVRCRRYVDEAIEGVNWKRDVSVMVGIEQPRLVGWGKSSTLVTLPLTGGHNNPRWLDDPSQLLIAMKARDLIAPKDLLNKPLDYRTASQLSNYDEYYVVHAEGFKPPHEVKTGFDFAELREVAASVSDILGLKLSCDQTLAPDEPASKIHLKHRPKIMYSLSDVQEKKFIRKEPEQSQEENDRQNQLERQQLIMEALRRATRGQPVCIVICWHNTVTRKTLEQEIRQAFFLSEHDALPDNVTVIAAPQPTPDVLILPLDSGSYSPQNHYKKYATSAERKKFQQAWETQMRLAFRAKTRAWEAYLQSLLPTSYSYGLALIELRPLNMNQYHYTQHIKGAVRRACNKLALASQMIYPMRQSERGKVSSTSLYRARNGVADLIYRQTGLVYGQPVDLYEKAGIPLEIATHLNVIALYNIRKNMPKVNYSIALRLCPDGQMQALLPHHTLQWLPLLDARNALLGDVFASGKKRSVELQAQEHAQFATRVFTEAFTEPTLVLLDAVDWRNYNILPQFANTNTLKNQLDLRHVEDFKHLYTSGELPNLRIVRLRTIGSSGETPQYFTVSDDTWDESDESKDLSYLAGFVDTQTESDFFHYLSIGQLPKTAKQQYQHPGLYKMDEGGGIAFKHQTIVEFVPFFLQERDEPLAWCRIPHFLRFAPAWDIGNIILPYPMHLAKCTIEDQICILEHLIDEEE